MAKQCCKEHIIEHTDIQAVMDNIRAYQPPDSKTNAQHRYTLYGNAVRILLQRGNQQYTQRHPLPAAIVNRIKSLYP